MGLRGKEETENEITKSKSLADVFYYLKMNIHLVKKQRKLGDAGQETSESEQRMCDLFLTANTCICALQYNRMRSFDFDQGNVVWDYLEDFLRDCFLIGRLAARAVLLRGHPGIKHNGRSQGDVR